MTLVREVIGDVGLSSPLREALNLAGVLLRCGLEGDAVVCGTPIVPYGGNSVPGSLRRDDQSAALAAQPLHVQLVATPAAKHGLPQQLPAQQV